MSGGRGEASEAAPTHDQEVEVLLLEEKKGLEIRRKELDHDQEVRLLLYGTKNANSGTQIKDHVYTHPHFNININIIFVCSCPDLGV